MTLMIVQIPEWWLFFIAGCWAWMAISLFVIAFKKDVDKQEKK